MKNERTCQWLAQAIDVARTKHNFALWAYVFMPEHVHLLIYPRQATYDMALIRKAIKQPVSQRTVAYLKDEPFCT